jgi:hypothetical protein
MFLSKENPKTHYETYILPGAGQYCTIKYPDSSLHQGEALIDTKTQSITPDGFGILVQPNGDYYKGEFSNGIKSGTGQEVGTDFSYVGDFAGGKPNGVGSVFGKGGKVIYHGEVKDG